VNTMNTQSGRWVLVDKNKAIIADRNKAIMLSVEKIEEFDPRTRYTRVSIPLSLSLAHSPSSTVYFVGLCI